ncbi:MFS transporter [Sporolactobacillus sp. Y61]|uniref:MFS transporter n=1 Tax=Sporolactobacillus sp. Y61 TaxID=3160863 RepID=A0AAU8II83_9BACL
MKKSSFILEKMGLPPDLIWGYVGLMFFVLGAGLEQSWFAAYLSSQGLHASQISLLFTVFGISAAVSSWVTGISTQIWGIRNVMWTGLIIYLIASIPFLLIALPSRQYAWILVTYMLRGAAYPLFAYSFLVWVTYRSEKAILGRATSWFWTFFGMGFTIIGPWYSGWMIPQLGYLGVLWTGVGFTLIGAGFSLMVNRDQVKALRSESALAEFVDGFLINFQRPRLGIAIIVKTINDLGKFGFVILMPVYLIHYGFSTSEWLMIWGFTNIVSLIFNYIFGYISDKIGWRQTVVWFSGSLCGTATFLIYFVPQWFGHNSGMLFAALSLYAIGIGAFCPLSALIPSLAPDKKGAAVSALNLGSGLSNFAGPLVVSLCIGPFGVKGAMFAIASLYLLASVLTISLKTPEEREMIKSNKRLKIGPQHET